MKLQLSLLGLVALAFAKPQDPSDPAPAPPVSSAPAEPPAPVPLPSSQPTPPTSPVPAPPADPAPAPPPADPTAAPTPEGPICECGYTYCAEVLKAMPGMYLYCTVKDNTNIPPSDKPWSDDQLSSAYCKTPNAVCNGQSPASKVDNALFICLCAQPDQKVGDHIELLCGCDTCLNVGPDFRGRCKSPCRAGHGKGGSGGGKGGGKIRGNNRMGFW